jgi:hypothetical protein
MNKIALLGELNRRYCSGVTPHQSVVEYLKVPYELSADDSKVFDDACCLMNEVRAGQVLNYLNQVSAIGTSRSSTGWRESYDKLISLRGGLTDREARVALQVLLIVNPTYPGRPLFEDAPA